MSSYAAELATRHSPLLTRHSNRRGIEADLGDELRQAQGSWAANADSFHCDLLKPSASETPRRRRARRANVVRQHLKADYILANPPFNMSDWGGDRLRDDSRWKYGAPPVGNANFAWVQHFIHHLAPTGLAGFVLANGSMSSNTGGEGDIRKAIIEADLVDKQYGRFFFTRSLTASMVLA